MGIFLQFLNAPHQRKNALHCYWFAVWLQQQLLPVTSSSITTWNTTTTSREGNLEQQLLDLIHSFRPMVSNTRSLTSLTIKVSVLPVTPFSVPLNQQLLLVQLKPRHQLPKHQLLVK